MLVDLTDHPDVTAIIPTLGAEESRLRACLAALEAQNSSLRLAILVIVNSPTAPSMVFAEPVATIAHAGMNLGWAGGLTFGRTLTDSRLLWLVQDDMIPESDCLDRLAAALDRDPGLASVAPIVVNDIGMVPRHSCGALLGPNGDIARAYPEQDTLPDALEDNSMLDYIPSRGTLVRTVDWDNVGGMDARFYPVLWADVDLCTAFRRAGRRFAIERSAVTGHQGSGSTPSALGQFLYGRNQVLYAAKWIVGEPAQAEGERPSSAGDLTGKLHLQIEPRLLATVAQSAADAFLHLARVHGSTVRDLTGRIAEQEATRHQLDVEIADYRNSTSWRVTRPLRWLGSVARGVLTAAKTKLGGRGGLGR